MLSTGMRRGEALGLKWEDVDLERGVVRIRRSLKREGGRIVTADTKTLMSRRAVNLPEPVVELLARHHDQQEKDRVDLGGGVGGDGLRLHVLDRHADRSAQPV